jgi:membrane-bound lytic murein transglycosylase D
MSATEGSRIVPRILKVRFGECPEGRRDLEFRQTFRIGRSNDCEVCITDDYVSRVHAEIAWVEGKWWVKDTGSSNGIYVGDQRIVQMPVGHNLTIRLGIYGPKVGLEVIQADAQPVLERIRPAGGDKTIIGHYVQRYFSKGAENETVGEHTMYLRKAFQQVQKKQKRTYANLIAGLFVLTLGVSGYAVYLRHEAAKQRAIAEQLFYSMKTLDLDIAKLEQVVVNSNSQLGAEEIREHRVRRQELENNYDHFLATLHVYKPNMSEQDKLILRVARIFGECELDAPPDFLSEVNRYIKKWQTSGRYVRAMQTAKQNGYIKPIADEFLSKGLPPQFFYLAMQESNFDTYAVGPLTRKGYAKGMWQFVPETALKYGLHLGPLVDLKRPDPGDERAHSDKATKAAASYVKDLYATDAQASGLLVMACYNWGEGQVLPLVRSMPANPRERNFWMLLRNHRDRIPQETYDYVFNIISAAVIGENPRLFGFDLDSPLAGK